MICSIEDLRFPIQKHKNHNVYVIFWDIKEKTFRCIFYLIGIIVLASGLTLNTKAGLGVSPIISTAYIFSDIIGFSKNLFDSFCVIIKLVIGLFTSRLFYGIRPGTVIAVLATGRVIHIFNQFTKYRLDTLAGL